MELFADIVVALRSFQEDLASRGQLRRVAAAEIAPWPSGPRGSIVFKEDTAVELGRPSDASVSFLVWTVRPDLVEDGTIALAGPDLQEADASHLPFGKAVILAVSGMDEAECHDRHRELELLRFDLSLKGYMIRAASRYMREWGRVSREALAAGLSLRNLGASLAARYRQVPYVRAVEILFLTESTEAVQELGRIGAKGHERVQAMNRMAEDLRLDCDACDYAAVCSEVSGLRSMHRRLAGRC